MVLFFSTHSLHAALFPSYFYSLFLIFYVCFCLRFSELIPVQSLLCLGSLIRSASFHVAAAVFFILIFGSLDLTTITDFCVEYKFRLVVRWLLQAIIAVFSADLFFHYCCCCCCY